MELIDNPFLFALLRHQLFIIRKEGFGGLLFDSAKKQFAVLNIEAFKTIQTLVTSGCHKDLQEFFVELGIQCSTTDIKILPEIDSIEGALSSPSLVFFVITNKCNLRCGHCFVANSVLSKNDDDLSLESIKKIALDLKQNNVFKIVVTGGEPFLRSDIVEILSFISDLGLEIQINTNGTVLTEATLVDLKKRNVSIIHFTLSLEGTQEFHDSIRGRGNFSQVVKAINRIKSFGYDVMVNITSRASVMTELNAIVDCVINLGVKKINFSMLRPSGTALKFLNQYYDYNLHDFKSFMEEVDQIQLKHGVETHLETLDSPMLFEFVDGYCGGATVSLAILPDGRVSPCTYLNEVLEHQDLKLDNILKKGLFAIWRESKAILWLRNYKNICVDCEYLKSCGQQCPIEAFARGDLFGRSLYCKKDDWRIKLNQKLNLPCS